MGMIFKYDFLKYKITNMKHFLILICISLSAISCQQNSNSEKLNVAKAASSMADSMELPSIFYKGILSIGHEAEYFVDCETSENWWIVFDEVEEELLKEYDDITDEVAFEEIYAEIKGYLEDAPKEGLASDYDKILNIVEIVHLDDLDGGNDCTKSSKNVN
jgi:hypothetical protein